MTRAALALPVLLALTAFAPAPFPKMERRARTDDGMSVHHFQGYWKLVRMESITRTNVDSEWKNWGIAGVRVKGDTWTYIQTDQKENASYSLLIPKASGATSIDWFNPGRAGRERAFMLGLIRRKGNRIEIVANSGANPDDRPKRFEDAPVGWWKMTLQKDRE